MSKFKPGQSGNPNGRPAGAKNKANAAVKALIEDILTDQTNTEYLKKAFNCLQPRDFIKAYTELLPYVIPKMNHNSLALDLDRLTDEQVDELYEKLIQELR